MYVPNMVKLLPECLFALYELGKQLCELGKASCGGRADAGSPYVRVWAQGMWCGLWVVRVEVGRGDYVRARPPAGARARGMGW